MSVGSVSVILPVMIRQSWQKHMTDACIKMMRDTTDLAPELVVVETLSADLGEAWKDWKGPSRYVYRPEKTTYIQDFNAGLDVATGDFVVQMGNDIFARPGWLEALLECFERFPDCGTASLGTWEGGGLGHRPVPAIVEGWYDPLMMWRKTDRPRDLWRLDEAYAGCFSTSDLIMRLYSAGYRSYRNHRVVCPHIGQQTWSDEEMNVVRPAATALFRERWGTSPLWPATMILAGQVGFGREYQRG